MTSVGKHWQQTIYGIWVIYSGVSCWIYIVPFSYLNPFFWVAWGWKLWPDMKCMTWFDSTFDKQILWRQEFFPPPLCTHVYNLCVCMRTQRWMQNCPLGTVKIHAKQTRDGNNRKGWEGGGVGGDETDGELDSSSHQGRRSELLAVKTQVRNIWLFLAKTRIMVRCFFLYVHLRMRSTTTSFNLSSTRT